MEVKIINKSNNPLPHYATPGSAGLDLCAALESSLTLAPMERQLVGTGLFLELPVGYEAQVRPRSGLALKHGLTVLNAPGTIDADYRGEVKVLLINLSDTPFTIYDGDRVAQMVISKCQQVIWKPVAILSPSKRGTGGYGSTGVKSKTDAED